VIFWCDNTLCYPGVGPPRVVMALQICIVCPDNCFM
jgi:hypothetical protein